MARLRAGALTASPVLVSGLVALGLAGIWLAAPLLGTDLSAQVARADFFAAHGYAPIDFRWYGGTSPLSYSLVAPPLMAWLGVRPVGAAAAVASTVVLAVLLVRTRAPRPLLGGVLGAVGFVGNLVSGRITFAVGVTCGLIALLFVLRKVPFFSNVPLEGHLPQESAPRGAPSWGRMLRKVPFLRLKSLEGHLPQTGAGLLAALAAAASPVAGLFVGLAGTAMLLHARLPRHGALAPPRLTWSGLALMIGAAVPMLVMAGLFGTGGPMNISRADMLHATLTSLVAAALVPYRAVRIGALLSAAGVVASYLLTTPVGLNATRLATLFALPLVAAYARVPDPVARWWQQHRLPRFRPALWLVPVLVGLVLWQPPVVAADLATAREPSASADFFTPLAVELDRRRPAGRVEVVPTVNYWEAARLGELPLARGWLRQADLERHRLFFDGTLDVETYRRWLDRMAVSHVALPHTRLSWVGQAEAELIDQGLPYLQEVWSTSDWTLYEVTDPAPLVSAPGMLVDATATGVEFTVSVPGEVRVAVWPSRWLAVDGPAGACLVPGDDHVVVRIAQPGSYVLTGSLAKSAPYC